ncbi:hypothetical protein B0T19DRAFT_399364 [Cercophora scortea]|uniref:non-specific serine/threonine protein kinase n=1 Tax=Cercophora scortea TaxID=314031 RepID=A0AAE0IYQ9_9PEZI|nr:hypothetical protein B0T19DRAFT_399364 [Cercophora scortea]
MASSYSHAAPATAPRPAAYGAPVAVAAPGAPAGTFSPGTKITVGGHRVVIQKYLSEGGFAHVYLVRMPTAVNGTDLAVLKRVAVPDKEALRGMRIEVETIKRLKGHRAIVTYIDSHASELRGGGYEVFLLMEYCNGGGLIDFMNTRLQHRLTEPEILNIFSDVAEGVACMHYLRPPLLHRDLKVENVLISMTGSVRKFKLCDFGSAAAPRPAPTTVVECRLIEEDVQKHTTMQYRSPEMIDVYRKLPIDEKSDIWALGVLLYKLCYYTTPFEEQGQLAILNASYKFPSYPIFSDRLKKLIAWMLRENPQARPNIYQALREACAMQGREPPIHDIYTAKSEKESSRQGYVSNHNNKSAPVVGAVFSPQETLQQQTLPEVERMRRGRPTVASHPAQQQPAKVTNGDPFAALDSKAPVHDADELSSRFPTLDQFSILHEHGTKFDFDGPSSQQPAKDLSQRVTERLADEVFQTKTSPSPTPLAGPRQSVESGRQNPYANASQDTQRVSPPLKSSSAPPRQPEMSRASAIISSTPELQAISSKASQPLQQQPTPVRPIMVSTGTMTSTPPPERQPSYQAQAQAQAPIYRFPPTDRHRASSVPRQQGTGPPAAGQTETSSSSRPSATIARIPSFQGQPQSAHMRHPSSSRPSLEGGRPSLETLEPAGQSYSNSSSRPRPVSTHLESNMDYLREREAYSKPSLSPGLPPLRKSFDKELPPPPGPEDERNIESNVDFLRSMEESSDPRKKEKSHFQKHHSKRSSLTSLGAGTKNILAGKFGDAFKRFETGNNASSTAPPRTPSPLKDLERRELTPIAGSEATDGRSDDGWLTRDGDSGDNGTNLTPEMRRDQEARMLAQEEARVAAAQAEHRQRVAQRGQGTGPIPLPKSIGGVSRAVSIQNKVQSLLDESSRSAAGVPKTAQGYGHFVDAGVRATTTNATGGPPPSVARKPVGQPATSTTTGNPTSSSSSSSSSSSAAMVEPAATGGRPGTAGRPMAPPKPTHLIRNLTSGSSAPAGARASSPPKPALPSSGVGVRVSKPRAAAGGGGIGPSSSSSEYNRGEMLVAVELPGQPAVQMTAAEKDDYIRDFQKRFPSLTSIEMVERDLAAEEAAASAGERERERERGRR